MHNPNFDELLMISAGLLGTNSVLQIPDKIRELHATIVRLRDALAAADAHFENCDYPRENGTCCLYCGVDLPKDLPADHKPDCDWLVSEQAYLATRALVDGDAPPRPLTSFSSPIPPPVH